jgi:hypothetical protein
VRSGLTAIAVGLMLAGAHLPRARAQECGALDFEGSAPLDGAGGVPTDALLHGRYGSQVVYSAEPVILEGPDGTVMAPVVFDGAEGSLIVTPDPMRPLSTYTVRWPALFDAAGRMGRGGVTTFTTGAGPDTTTPGIGTFDVTGWDVVGDHDACTDAREDRWTFTFDVTGLADDSGPGGLEVLVLQTFRPDRPDETDPDVVAVTGVLAFDDTISIRLARARGLGRVCFAAIARDLVGRPSAASPETCTHTRAPPFFDGCSASPRARGPSGPASWLWIAALALAISRGRRGPCRCASPDRRA